MCLRGSGQQRFEDNQGEIAVSSETNAHDSTDPKHLWKVWNETTRMQPDTLESGGEAYGDFFDLYHFWMKGVGVAQGQLKSSPLRIIDPVEVWKLWADATVDAWRTSIEVYTASVRAFYLVSKKISQNFQIPTRSDIARVEELVASLEERVYTIEDAFVNFEDSYLKVVTDQMVEGLAGHLERVENKLHILDARSSIPQQTEVLEDLAERLERVEGKLNVLLVALEEIKARGSAEATEPSSLDIPPA